MKRPFLSWPILLPGLVLGPVLGLVLAACAGRPEEPAVSDETTLIGAGGATAHQGPESCPLTRAPAQRFVPPEPYPEWLEAGRFWLGTAELWTSLPIDHTWSGLPRDEGDGGYVQKTFWWRQGYDWQEEPLPALTVTGRRLDGEAPPLSAHKATNGFHNVLQSFMLSGVSVPTAGCWEITARYESPDGGPAAELSYVIWVGP